MLIKQRLARGAAVELPIRAAEAALVARLWQDLDLQREIPRRLRCNFNGSNLNLDLMVSNKI